MLLRRVGIAFILEHLQPINQLDARVAWLNDFIDIATAGRDIGIVELLCVLRDQLFAPLFRVVCLLDLAAEENIDRTFWTHHRDFPSWPGIVEVASHMLATHY